MTDDEFARLCAIIAEKARDCLNESSRTADLTLAGWLYAACLKVYHDKSNGWLRAPLWRPKLDPDLQTETTLQRLCDLHPPEDLPENLYCYGVDYILGMNSRVQKRDVVTHRVPLQDPLVGTVHCWIGETSAWSRLWNRRNKWGEKQPMAYRALPLRLEKLSMYWDRGLGPCAECADPLNRDDRSQRTLLKTSGEVLQSGTFRIALCPLPEKIHPVFRVHSRTVTDADVAVSVFMTTDDSSISHPEQLKEHINSLFVGATDASRPVHMLLFPELSIDRPAREHLISKLHELNNINSRGGNATPPDGKTPLAIVAGSFHLSPSHGAWNSTSSEMPVNRAFMLDRDGSTLWQHDKGGRFQIEGRKLASYVEQGFFLPMGEGIRVGTVIPEGIRHGNTVRFVHTTLGRFAILICADAIDREIDYTNPLRQVDVDFVLVVSMSEKTTEFEHFAKAMNSFGISVFFVNASSVVEPGGLLVLVSLSLNNSHLGRECRAPRLDAEWRKGETPPSDGESMELLADATGNPMALVVDLGPHWRSVPPGQESEL